MTRLLFVGPVPAATRDLTRAAAAAGHIVFRSTLDDASASVRIDAPDVVIVDPRAEQGAGFAAARRLRKTRCDAGVVLITGDDPAIESVVDWLRYADHCLLGVLDPAEVLAHVGAVDRRRHGWTTSRVEVDGVAVDTVLRLAEVRGVPLALTATEYALLELLVTRSGRCITKEAILDHLYGGMDEPDLKMVDVLVCKMRNKLSAAGARRTFIETIWGRGYVVRRAPAEARAA